MTLRILLSAISWILFSILRTILIVLGYIAVPIGLLTGTKVRQSKIYIGKEVRVFCLPLVWLWGNEEEGLGWYDTITIDFRLKIKVFSFVLIDKPIYKQIKFKSQTAKILYSECIRNPVNNLRFVPVLSVKIEPSKVKFIGSLGSSDDNLSEEVIRKYDDDKVDFWSFTWQGLYSNFRWQGPVRGVRKRFWIGHKLYPEDIYGVPEWDHRKARAGFATQYKSI